MKDLFKKGIMFGLGATVASAEKVEESIADLVKKGKITQEEANATIKNILENSKKEFDEARGDVHSWFMDTVNSMGFVTEDQLRSLNQRIARLESELDRLMSEKKD